MWKERGYCNVAMPFEDTNTSEFNQYHVFDKTPLTIYAYLESLIKQLMDVKIILKN